LRVDVELGRGVGKTQAAGKRQERVLELVLGRCASDVVGVEEVFATVTSAWVRVVDV
jgi:hypothetical protein